MLKRIGAALLVSAAAATMTTLTAAPASAAEEVRSHCGHGVCVAVRIDYRWSRYARVVDMTVSTVNKKPAKLHGFIADWSRWADNKHNQFWSVGQDFDRSTWACGEAWVGDHMIDRPCVRI
ncbi:hypothetical protein [Allokutzneria sp. NRRL B-24872]|uniref:hypothetical protein n=1 Tax=Allokutzneria sp. NRRL B-24872 TaxID=1137961 RepID=UPI000A387547|nr:hypothetical protein [Allokutzneria sp. NRRL B-24872]